MKQLDNIDDLIHFLDRKIHRLHVAITNGSTEKETNEKEISMWRNKKVQLIELQEKMFDEQIKELTV